MSNEAKAGVLQGTLDLMVLQTLVTLGPQHGYAIAARIEQVSSGAIQLNMGTLYPGLLRLEQRGFIRAEVVAYDAFIARGSMAACRDHGEIRLEGKEYIVHDGDMINFRHAT